MNNNETITNELDNTDKEIIKQLNQDGRKSYRQIAKELNLSVGTITNRVQKLKQIGIIKGFQIILDYEQLGYSLNTMIELQHNGNLEEIIRKEAYQDNIVTAHKTTGQYDALLITQFKDATELNTFLETLVEEDNVKRTNTQLILKVIDS